MSTVIRCPFNGHGMSTSAAGEGATSFGRSSMAYRAARARSVTSPTWSLRSGPVKPPERRRAGSFCAPTQVARVRPDTATRAWSARRGIATPMLLAPPCGCVNSHNHTANRGRTRRTGAPSRD